MPEYISREAALTIMERLRDKCGNDEMAFALNWASRLIRDTPAADVVEVVRCRECIYNRGESKDLWGNPAIVCATAVEHAPDWYCASGKRRDGGQEDV